MSKRSEYIGKLETLLTHLKNAKLEYLKAADQISIADFKRHLNQQATMRNRLFHEVLGELRRLGLTLDDLIISRFNFDQLLISSIDMLQASAMEKCLQADQIVLDLYQEIAALNISSVVFTEPINTIKEALQKNREIASTYVLKDEAKKMY